MFPAGYRFSLLFAKCQEWLHRSDGDIHLTAPYGSHGNNVLAVMEKSGMGIQMVHRTATFEDRPWHSGEYVDLLAAFPVKEYHAAGSAAPFVGRIVTHPQPAVIGVAMAHTMSPYMIQFLGMYVIFIHTFQ